jgi:hypothetical protein
MSAITMAKATEQGNSSAAKNQSSSDDEVQLCAIKILSKNSIIKAK